MSKVTKNLRRVLTLTVVAVVVLFLAQGIVSTALSDSPAQSRPEDVRVADRTAEPSAGEDFRLAIPRGNWIAARGIVEPHERPTDVSGAEGGLLTAIFVDEGDHVDAGAPLARLDDAIQSAELEVAEADVEVARIELQRAESGSLLLGIRTARADLDAAQAAATFAERRARRQEALLETTVVSAEQVEEAQLQETATASRAVSSRARLEQLESERVETLREAQARLVNAQARLSRARAALDRRTVRSPQVGEVLQVKYLAGEYYAPEGLEPEPLLVLGDTRTLRVRADVDERDVTGLEVGRRARVRTPADPQRYFEGTVSEIGRKMGRKNIRTDDPIERTDTKILEVLIDIDDADNLLVGQRVDAFIEH